MKGATCALLSIALAAAPLPPVARGAERPGARALCTGRYADALDAMNAAAHARAARPAAEYAYCLRAIAVYEQVSYGRGGKLRRQYHTKVRHGTGFAYRQRGGEWLVATNEHVISFPEVTGGGVEVEGIPAGARRIRQEVRIVSTEAEADSADQIRLAEVVRDVPLDVAVLSSRSPLRVVPYRFGRSADLRVGNAVLVRGFPLGAFPAANAGRVIALGQHDGERGWDHEDFAVDALLNLGSSGSPVLAISCETGEPEVVGIYHAGYRGAQGLNVVIGIDQIRGVLEDLRAPLRAAGDAEPPVEPGEGRAALERGPVVMPFGGRAVRVVREGDAVRFSFLDPSYPLSVRIDFSILDRGLPAAGRAAELRDALYQQLALVARYRAAEDARDGRRAPATLARIADELRGRGEDQEDLVAAIEAGADGLGPMTVGERDSVRRPAEGAGRPGPGGRELVLGAR